VKRAAKNRAATARGTIGARPQKQGNTEAQNDDYNAPPSRSIVPGREGCIFVNHETQYENTFYDEDEIRDLSYKEPRTGKSTSGSKRVVVSSHLALRRRGRCVKRNRSAGPVLHAHNDYTDWSVAAALARTLPPTKAESFSNAALPSSKPGRPINSRASFQPLAIAVRAGGIGTKETCRHPRDYPDRSAKPLQ